MGRHAATLLSLDSVAVANSRRESLHVAADGACYSVNVVWTMVVTYADERKEETPVAGPLTVRIGNRFMTTDCIVGPPLSQPLLGQIVLEALDLVVDCAKRTLGPQPESPDYPLLNLR